VVLVELSRVVVAVAVQAVAVVADLVDLGHQVELELLAKVTMVVLVFLLTMTLVAVVAVLEQRVVMPHNLALVMVAQVLPLLLQDPL
jgi:hypothetical protein